MDIFECICGRSLNWSTMPAVFAGHKLEERLSQPETSKVVLIGHSQGCIIAANTLLYLEKRRKQSKALFFFFGSC